MTRAQGYIQDYDMAQCGVSATSELTQQSGFLTHLASDLGWARQKVRLYGTFLSGLCHLPLQMKNQNGLNEKKAFIGNKILSQFSACVVTRVVSLDTNNQV
jgi:hypothetical protein